MIRARLTGTLAANLMVVLFCSDTLAAPAIGAQPNLDPLYASKCGICHEPGGTGWFQLAKRYGPEGAILRLRPDLEPQLIRTAVRRGIGSMPALTRAEVTESELTAIQTYLLGEARTR